MGCSNCKKKLDKNIKDFVPSFKDTLNGMKQKRKEFVDEHLDLSVFDYTIKEHILVFIFGWFPIIIGYITIISFIVDLF
jgi:hypothetical protein|tara:strand:- start:351 stop:587 length:237 start_codon:yes stop_codon:yes gene_type:complete